MRSIGIVFKKNEMLMVVARHGIRRYLLEAYRILPFLDSSEEEKEAAILHNLERFLKDYRGVRDNIFAALPRSDAFIHYVHLPLAAEEDLHTAIGYDIDRHSPFGSEDVYYDCHVVRRMPESGQLYAMLLIVPRAKIDFLIGLFSKLKIRLQGIELTTTALVNGHTPLPESEPVVDAAAFLNNKYVRKVLNPLASRIPGLKKKLEAQADAPAPAPEGPPPVVMALEYLDNEHYELGAVADGVLHYSNVFPCLSREPGQEQLQEMLNHGEQACIHLPFDLVDERPLRFVLSGRELNRDCLAGVPSDPGDHFSVMRSLPLQANSRQDGSFAELSPLLFAPFSLAMKGLHPVGLDVNFIPSHLRPRRKKSKRKLVMAAGVCALAGIIVALVWRWDIGRSAEQKRVLGELAEITREYRLVEARNAEIERIDALYETARQLGSRDVGKLDILRELTEIIPSDAWLTEFKYRADRNEVRLSGYAVTASQLLPVLDQSDMFENVRFTSPITTDRRTNKEQFRLEMSLTTADQEAQ